MQWLFIIIGILWIVMSAAGNKKKQQARKDAEQRQSPAESPWTAQQTQTQSRPAVPVPPQMRPAAPVQQARQPIQRTPVTTPAAKQTVPAAQIQQRVSGARTQAAPTSRLTELQQTSQHTLRPSSETGHAHQETSMTGFQTDCPPESKMRTADETSTTAYAGLPSFSWNNNAVLNGIVYAEILGKPKALRG